MCTYVCVRMYASVCVYAVSTRLCMYLCHVCWCVCVMHACIYVVIVWFMHACVRAHVNPVAVPRSPSLSAASLFAPAFSNTSHAWRLPANTTQETLHMTGNCLRTHHKKHFTCLATACEHITRNTSHAWRLPANTTQETLHMPDDCLRTQHKKHFTCLATACEHNTRNTSHAWRLPANTTQETLHMPDDCLRTQHKKHFTFMFIFYQTDQLQCASVLETTDIQQETKHCLQTVTILR